MPTVAIVVHSVTGNTATIAEQIAAGVVATGTKASLVNVEGSDIIEGRYINQHSLQIVDNADAVIFGAPTFMGGPSAQFKAFADASSDRWEQQRWHNKWAAGFTTGTCLNGDQTSTLQYFTVLAAQHGMLWVSLDKPADVDTSAPNRLGVQLGAVATIGNDGVSQSDANTACYLGQRIGTFALHGKPYP